MQKSPTVSVQIMTQAQADSFRWNPFDLTKVWPHKEFPLIENKIGYVRLTQFGERTSLELDAGLKKMKAQGMQSLIVPEVSITIRLSDVVQLSCRADNSTRR